MSVRLLGPSRVSPTGRTPHFIYSWRDASPARQRAGISTTLDPVEPRLGALGGGGGQCTDARIQVQGCVTRIPVESRGGPALLRREVAQAARLRVSRRRPRARQGAGRPPPGGRGRGPRADLCVAPPPPEASAGPAGAAARRTPPPPPRTGGARPTHPRGGGEVGGAGRSGRERVGGGGRSRQEGGWTPGRRRWRCRGT